MELGSMYLIYNKALAASTSDMVSLYQIVKDEEDGIRRWELYHSVVKRGFLYFIKGNVRIQIITDEKIFFYTMDKETLLPTLENVMYNYMDCVQMMIGPKVRYCVTYKPG